MFSPMNENGSFAKSLRGGSDCFELATTCRCRSKRKTRPRKPSPKAPFAAAPEPGEESIKRRRLTALLQNACCCYKDTSKARWFQRNQSVIIALALALNRPIEKVHDFLHSLTLQNFSCLLNPTGPHPCGWRVPLADANICDHYMGIFDRRGNVRNPFDQDSLKTLLRLMQIVLKREEKGGRPDTAPMQGILLGNQAPRSRESERAKRAGIDRASLARQNGIRRLRQANLKAEENRNHLRKYVPDTHVDVGYVFWDDMESVVPPRNTSDGWDKGTEQGQLLSDMIDMLNRKTPLTNDSRDLVSAIKTLNLDTPESIRAMVDQKQSHYSAIARDYYDKMKMISDGKRDKDLSNSWKIWPRGLTGIKPIPEEPEWDPCAGQRPL